MADTPDNRDIDPQLEERLRSYRDLIAFPPAADSASPARARIEARRSSPVESASTLSPFVGWDDEPADTITHGSVAHFPQEQRASGLRQTLQLAAAGLAILILGGALLLIVPLLGGDGEFVGTLGPETGEYRFAGAIGGSIVPNEPVSVAVDADGAIYAVDIATRSVHTFNSGGEHVDSWSADDAEIGSFLRPWDIAVQDGTVYVLDQLRSAVYVFSLDGDVESAWHVGDPEEPSDLVSGIAVDADGLIYVTRANDGMIAVYQSDGEHLRDIQVANDPASGGDRPADVAVGHDGTVYITAFSGESVRSYSPDGALLAEWTDVDIASQFQGGLYGITVAASGDLYASSDSGVVQLSPQGKVLGSWSIDDGLPMAQTSPPGSAAVDAQGNVYMADPANHRIVVLSSGGEIIHEIRDSRQDRFAFPGGIVAGEGDALYVADAVLKRVVELTSDGNAVRTLPWDANTPGPPVTSQSGALTVSEDHIYVLDWPNSAIVKMTMDGEQVLQWSGSLVEDDVWSRPTHLDSDGYGNIYLLDSGAGAIYQYSSEGEFIGRWGDQPAGEASNAPLSMSVQGDRVYVAYASGPRAGVWIHDLQSSVIERVVEFGLDAEGNPDILPAGLAVANTGDMFIVDAFARSVHWYGPDGTLNGEWPVDAPMERTFTYLAIAVDESGTLYISDSGSRQILVYEPAE